MKNLIVWLATLGIIAIASTVTVCAADAKNDPQADKDWEAFQKVNNASPSKPWEDMAPRERAEWAEIFSLEQRKLGLDFIEKHPKDPRRWNITDGFDSDYPRFIKEWGGFNSEGVDTNSIVDKEAVAAWKLKVKELKDAMKLASDVPENVRDQQAMQEAMSPFYAASKAQDKGEKVDLSGLRKQLLDNLSKNPHSSYGHHLLTYYILIVDEQEPSRVEEICRTLADSPNTNITQIVKGKLSFFELAKKPIDITYTALDDKIVDLKKLRGKVVLVDFWATWCGPCVAELPNIKKVYDKYHDKGLEVVGISLEMANLNPEDTPDQTTAKLNKSKTALLQFLAKRNMTWPQYFDGKGWENPFSKRYALSGIPALFLLDQEGKIVTTRARGDVLEKEVKRLLKL